MTLLKAGIEEYAKSKTGPIDPLLAELAKETEESMDMPQMLTGLLEGTFLKLMAQILQAKSVLEIGTFTGYSALSMAAGIPEDGELITLDIDPKAIAVAKKYFARSNHGKKIRVVEGAALDSLKKLNGPFDLVFIDADKPNYSNYYKSVMPKLRTGGILLIDNVLWEGEVLNPQTEAALAISDLNKLVFADETVDKVLVTIRDGVYLIRKK